MESKKTKINILILSHLDPLGDGIGGTKSFIKGFVENAPDNFTIEWVGVSIDRKERPVGRWQKIKIGDKSFNFLPVLFIRSENIKTRLPLTFYYVLSLFKYKFKIHLEDKILEFHRIENALPFRSVTNKKILYIHGNIKKVFDPYSEGKWSKLPWVYPKIERKIITRMDKIFVVSTEGLEYYKKQYPFMVNKFVFMPTFVDTNKFYPYPSVKEKKIKSSEFKNKYGFSEEDKIIIFVGRLENSKNPLLLINSFYYLRKNYPNVVLLIIGTGSFEKIIAKKIKEYGLEEKVKLFGAVFNEEVLKLLRLSDVFLMTSAFEGMPISVLEALASGLPVVSTDVGEVKKVVKDGFSGRVVSNHSKDDIAKAVFEVLNDKEKFNAKNCVDSIKDYTVESVLSGIYKMHYDMII